MTARQIVKRSLRAMVAAKVFVSDHGRITAALLYDRDRSPAGRPTPSNLSQPPLPVYLRGAAPAAPAGGASSPLRSARIHLGSFEGERKRRAAGSREDYGVVKSLASLAVVTAFLFVASVILETI